MTDDVRATCADLVVAGAIQDMVAGGMTAAEARRAVLSSAAYGAIYDLETGLWGEGPDYFASLCLGGPVA